MIPMAMVFYRQPIHGMVRLGISSHVASVLVGRGHVSKSNLLITLPRIPIQMVKKVLREIKNDKGHVIQTQEEFVKEPVHAPAPQPKLEQSTQKIQENVKVNDSVASTKTAVKKSK